MVSVLQWLKHILLLDPGTYQITKYRSTANVFYDIVCKRVANTIVSCYSFRYVFTYVCGKAISFAYQRVRQSHLIDNAGLLNICEKCTMIDIS